VESPERMSLGEPSANYRCTGRINRSSLAKPQFVTWVGATNGTRLRTSRILLAVVSPGNRVLALAPQSLNLVPFVGATCAGCAPPVSWLGVFHLSAQRLHPSAQRHAVTEGRAGGSTSSPARFDIIQITLSAAWEFAIWWLDARIPCATQVCEEPTAFFARPGACPRLEPLIDTRHRAA